MRKNSLKRIFAALALTAVATTSVATISAFAEPSAEEETTAASEEETTVAEEETTVEETTAEETTVEETTAAPEKQYTADNGFTAEQIAAAPVKPTITIEKKTLSAADAAGKEVTLTYSVNVGDWASTGVHINYDSRLTLTDKEWSAAVNKCDSIGAKKFQEYTNGIFITTAADANTGISGEMVTLTFKVPADAKAGDFYPVTFEYVAKDLFTNAKDDETGKLMQAYTFTKGLANGGIEIAAEPTPGVVTTTTVPATTTAPVTTTTAKVTTTTGTTKKTESPKTGVAGVGVAAAGLVVAAGAAFVLRKKED